MTDWVEITERTNIPELFERRVGELKGKGDERTASCPFCDDTKDHFGINVTTGLWHCLKCGVGGNLSKWIERENNCTASEAFKIAAESVGIELKGQPPRVVAAQNIEGWYTRALNNPSVMAWFRDKRGYTTETLERFNLGWDGTRVTIPYYAGNKPHNIKAMYMVTPPERSKAVWKKEGLASLIFPAQVVPEDEVWLCEGEWDTILLRQLGFASYCGSCGAGTWHPHWSAAFEGKIVNLCYDLDKAGEDGARRVCKALGAVAQVRNIRLPVEDAPEGYDLTDWLTKGGATPDDLQTLAESVPFHVPEQFHLSTDGTGIGDLLPKSGWLRAYVEWATRPTDAPPLFHLATGLTIMGAAIGNRIYLEGWGMRIHPNLWSVLIAPSSFFRKSTAMNYGIRLLQQADGTIFPNQFTKESLLDVLHKDPGGLIPVWEFGQFLASLGQDYNKGLREMVTELYDYQGAYKRETKAGKAAPEYPAISILAGSTIDWLQGRAQAGDVESGFLPRFLFWPATEKLEWKGWTYADHGPVEDELREHLKALHDWGAAAPMTPDDSIRDRFDEWDKQYENAVIQDNLPARLQGFYTRLATYALKFAVLYQESLDLTLTLHAPALEYGLRLAEYLKRAVTQIVEEELVSGREAQELRLVKRLVKEAGEIGHTILLQRSHMKARSLNELVATLIESGEIVCSAARQGARGPATRVYVLRNARQ